MNISLGKIGNSCLLFPNKQQTEAVAVRELLQHIIGDINVPSQVFCLHFLSSSLNLGFQLFWHGKFDMSLLCLPLGADAICLHTYTLRFVLIFFPFLGLSLFLLGLLSLHLVDVVVRTEHRVVELARINWFTWVIVLLYKYTVNSTRVNIMIWIIFVSIVLLN